jgi:DNA-binding transcriptional regulator YdaS (Cro superfamily)
MVMKLSEWISTKEISFSALAQLLGVTPPAARRYVEGKRIPHPEIMTTIFRVTKGLVTPNDFYNCTNLSRKERLKNDKD